jgi:hypothetical protein
MYVCTFKLVLICKLLIGIENAAGRGYILWSTEAKIRESDFLQILPFARCVDLALCKICSICTCKRQDATLCCFLLCLIGMLHAQENVYIACVYHVIVQRVNT